ncbi:MAG: TonB-dependent receptor [Pseudomonadales bacterium]
MTVFSNTRLPYFVLVICSCLLTSALAQAQLQLEEVIVTTQKREQSLQDVAISVSVVGGDVLRDANLNSLNDMQVMVPNFKMTDNNVVATWIYIRGIGSGSNDGFEQSVGLFVDEIYGGRGRQFRAPFLDIERVEVLRGPQGALFGKNTIAGAVNITTARPSDELEGYVEGIYEPDANEQRLTGVISGAISDAATGRVAATWSENDGFLENSFPGANENAFAEEELVMRGWLQFDLNENATLALKYEEGQFDRTGMNTQISLSPAGFVPTFTAADPAFNDTLDDEVSFGGTPVSGGFSGEDAFDNTDTTNFLARLDYELGEYILSYIGGYSQFEFERMLDTDFSPVNLLITYTPNDEFEQTSHEFRLVSPPGENFDWIAGAYYQDSDYKTARQNFLNGATFSSALQTRTQVLANQPLTTPTDCTTLDSIFGPTLAGGPAALAPILGDVNNPSRGGVLVSLACTLSGNSAADYEQNNETLSFYAEGTWHLNDRLHASLGLRWTDDKKTGDQNFVLLDPTGVARDVNTADPIVQNALLANSIFFGNAIHQFSSDRDETNLSAAGKVSWDVADTGTLYLSVAQGFKAGGFNVQQTGDDFNNFEFEDETALTVEVGGKFSLAGGAARLNFAVFNTQYDDLQVSIFNGVSFDVQNAAEVTSRGIELDGTWMLNEQLTIGGALAYLDSSYDSFPNAPCLAPDETRARVAGLPPCFQDLGGVNTNFAPEYSGNLYIDWRLPLGDSFLVSTRLAVVFTDESTFAGDNDPQESVDANTVIDGRLAIGAPDGQWEIALVGKNLTDEIEVANYGADVPLLTGTHFAAVTRGTSVALQARYRF